MKRSIINGHYQTQCRKSGLAGIAAAAATLSVSTPQQFSKEAAWDLERSRSLGRFDLCPTETQSTDRLTKLVTNFNWCTEIHSIQYLSELSTTHCLSVTRVKTKTQIQKHPLLNKVVTLRPRYSWNESEWEIIFSGPLNFRSTYVLSIDARHDLNWQRERWAH